MTKKLLAKPKFSIKISILALTICALFISIGFFMLSSRIIPLPFSLLFIAIPFLVIILVGLTLTRGRKLSSKLSQLYNECKVINDKIILPRKMRVKYGKIIIYSEKHTYYSGPRGTPRTRIRLNFDFNELDSLEANELTIPENEDYTILIGDSYGIYMEFPVFILDEPEFKSIIGDIIIIAFKPLNLKINFTQYERYLAYNSDYIITDLESENSLLNGSITLFSSTTPKIRSARVELSCKVPAEGTSKIILTKVDRNNKSKPFSYNFQLIREPIVIFAINNELSLNISKITKLLNLSKPVFQGVIDENWNLELRTILDIPFRKDVVSKTNLAVTKVI